MWKRREVLKRGTGALLVAGAAPVVWFSGAGPAVASNVEPYDRARFEALVGQWVHVDTGDWQSMRVVAVEDGPSDPRVDQFSVVLSGSTAPEAGTYDIAPPEGEPIQLYLQPTGDGSTARAQFSQVRPLNAGC